MQKSRQTFPKSKTGFTNSQTFTKMQNIPTRAKAKALKVFGVLKWTTFASSFNMEIKIS